MADNLFAPAESERWYFAYGSNLCSSVLTGKRGVVPRESRVVSLPGYALCFNILFLPYSEPAMAGLRRRSDKEPPVYGVAHLLSHSDFMRVLVTEGGGVAYSVLEADGVDGEGRMVRVQTLVARVESSFAKGRHPSRRYMGLLLSGAMEWDLPLKYQHSLACTPTFIAGASLRWRVGRWLFQCIWHKISVLVQIGTRKLSNQKGEVPLWFLVVFDGLLWLMWFHHDYIQAPLFGRGDGRI